MNNPFVTNGYAGPEYFCDRVEETDFLVRMLTNENNVALISPRRIGKTDLIRHCFEQATIKEHYHTFVVDVYSTQNLQDFVNVFGRAILEGLRSKGRSAWELFLQVVASLRTEVSFDINGMPVWSISLGTIASPIVTLDEIFQYLNKADLRCLVAIDEFQQITNYEDGTNVEAALRTYIQRCPNANFIFSGSHRHLMGDIFTSPSRPFYQSVTIFNLKPIAMDKYMAFASDKFERAGKHLAEDVVPTLYQRFHSTTAYIQKVMNYMYQITNRDGTCTISFIDEAINYILDISSDTYEGLLYQMPDKQKKVFIAIATEREAKGISGGRFAKKYKLVSPSSVVSAVKGLLEKDFITQDKGAYYVYDKLFQLWLEREHRL